MISKAVCENFNLPDIQSNRPLSAGLINKSYKVTLKNGNSYFLQRINTYVFKNPMALQRNYQQIQDHLSAESASELPKLIKTISGNLLYETNGEVWRCFEFLNGTYSPDSVNTPEKAYEVAKCFGSFTAVMQNFDSSRLEVILPDFHNLDFRFRQFTSALKKASAERILMVKDMIRRVEDYTSLINWFNKIMSDKKSFPVHIMHHDCKISNILFDINSDKIRCPIDLDTTQPGLFFSDIGDMIRTIVTSTNEDTANPDDIQIRPDFFKSVMQGYMDAMSAFLTPEEKSSIHYSGSIMIYMQAIRFLTDYLNGNIYYKTEYPDQNKDRTANQLRLLDLLQEYVTDKKHRFT